MSDKNFCQIDNAYESKPVSQVLHSVVDEARDNIKKLTDEEIEYCIARTSKTTVWRMLKAEKRKRKKAPCP